MLFIPFSSESCGFLNQKKFLLKAVILSVPVICIFLLLACGGTASRNGQSDAAGANGADSATGASGIRYRAELSPLNGAVTGYRPSGTVTFEETSDSLLIVVDASGLPPGIMHWQHSHGFVRDRDASCVSMDQDVNSDGVVDLIETVPVSGVTLVPFHDNPASLDIVTQTYPTADAQGNMRYRRAVHLDTLRTALQSKYGITDLALEKHVVYLHGVGEQTVLPPTARSLEGVPADVSLPIACGKIIRQ